MRDITKIIISIICLLVFVYSCKKGKDDPWLTLKSRDARIQGEWILTDWEGSITFQDSLYREINSYIMDDKILNISTTIIEKKASGNTDTTEIDERFNVTHTMMINKDGTVANRYTGVNLLGGNDVTYANDGLWTWASGGKKKQGIVIEGFPLAWSSENIYSIRELRAKNLVLDLDFINSNIYPNYVVKIEGQFQFKFEKQ